MGSEPTCHVRLYQCARVRNTTAADPITVVHDDAECCGAGFSECAHHPSSLSRHLRCWSLPSRASPTGSPEAGAGNPLNPPQSRAGSVRDIKQP